MIEVRDDGRGIDTTKVVARAQAMGLVAEGALPAGAEALGLIFEPGFSTTQEVTDISGRGVGLDVVRTAVEGVGGRVSIVSELGKGTCFRLSFPNESGLGGTWNPALPAEA